MRIDVEKNKIQLQDRIYHFEGGDQCTFHKVNYEDSMGTRRNILYTSDDRLIQVCKEPLAIEITAYPNEPGDECKKIFNLPRKSIFTEGKLSFKHGGKFPAVVITDDFEQDIHDFINKHIWTFANLGRVRLTIEEIVEDTNG